MRAGTGKTRSISPPSTGQTCPRVEEVEEEEEEEEDSITTEPDQRTKTVRDITRRTPTTTVSAPGFPCFPSPSRTKKAITTLRPQGESGEIPSW